MSGAHHTRQDGDVNHTHIDHTVAVSSIPCYSKLAIPAVRFTLFTMPANRIRSTGLCLVYRASRF